jgi:hypothetical protein
VAGAIAGILVYLVSAGFGILALVVAGLVPAGVQERLIVTRILGHLASVGVTRRSWPSTWPCITHAICAAKVVIWRHGWER